jgi:hypothetical protein
VIHCRRSRRRSCRNEKQLARAYVLAGDKDKARTACRVFLALWRDADSDIPLLKDVKAEYFKL